eukprot:CAMPEP_0119003352 /NCGR_PEP_ID=MMETSP1176-20130426/514_1 /TAXON_ID=265551 /ORGANISM="Synedropsis recta cf, Strain CCMP1620" /LENGTH=113 /DNA_ID=CAMNT_0006954947 /DNA_START=72 /DNA_END=413 /DNA_ORIENTATION=+
MTTPTKVCHVLPCSIDYQGMAPVHVYFHPTETTIGSNEKAHQAQFRGRKLIAKPATPLSGIVLSSANSKKIQFDGIQEWHHEETLVGTKSRVEAALEWSTVAQAVHDDIPVEE